ncbi:unnamed protein product [Adineta steineri]|uniref:RRM domain-containing protein n=1 Tax=Adineta steineri TaxID=433720 RepID=A0A819DME3_9BILA|nr:unnamed protein product [Adineta steineri]
MGNEASTPDVPQPTPLIEDHLLIWTDGSIGKNDEHSQDTLSELHKAVKKVETCTKSEQCIKLLNGMNNEKVLIICSGSLGKDLVSQIHHMPNLVGIYIFCGNEAFHTEWTTNWPKIKLVSTKIESICNAMKKELIDSIPKKDPELPVEEKKDKSNEQTPNPGPPVEENQDTPKEQAPNPGPLVEKNQDTPKEQAPNPGPPVEEKKDTPKEQTSDSEVPVKETKDTSKKQISNPDMTSQPKVALQPTDPPNKAFPLSPHDTIKSDSLYPDPNARVDDNPTSVAAIDGDDQDQESSDEKSESTDDTNSVTSGSVVGEPSVDKRGIYKPSVGGLANAGLFKKNTIFIHGLPSTMPEQLLFDTLRDAFCTVGRIKVTIKHIL